MNTETIVAEPRTSTEPARPRPGARLDARGCPVSTRSQAAIDRAEHAQWILLSYYGDALAALDEAIAADPHWALAHLMKANALLTVNEHGFTALARASFEQAKALAERANDRERAHMAATELCLAGQWAGACDAWERILLEHPQDLVALGAAHIFDFFRGDARSLQRRVTRVLPEWSASAPLYSYVLGMHAFGLEENNHYARAQEAGQAALAIERRDPWAVHAVTHVHEMQGQYERGARWLESCSGDWAPDNGFSYHNWWHLALFRLERLDTAGALALLDERVTPGAELALQRVDITALLWRLRLLGVDVGSRWEAIADAWAAQPAEAGHYCFNDLHAALALVGAGRLQAAETLLGAVRRRGLDHSTPGMMAREVGEPLLRGLLAHASERHAEAVEILWPARETCHRFGGSHAQRDLIDQTLLDAAIRGGDSRLAKRLLNERALMKASSPLTEHWAQRIG